MYAKFQSIDIAHRVFDEMHTRTMVSWNAMISGYAQNGYYDEALALFQQMQMTNVSPNRVTIVSVLPACAELGDLQQVKDIHDYVFRNRLESDVTVHCSLIAMYSKCGAVDIARQLFDNTLKSDVAPWNAMIAGYAQTGHAHESLMLFHQMQLVDTKPDPITILSVIPACAHIAALQQGKVIHAYVISSGFESDVSVGTALIDMYAKCGRTEIARQLFDNMPERNLITWSAMIAGYGTHGYGEDALTLFSNMQEAGIKPDYITFTCVLCACSHAGLVDEGWEYFESMTRDYCITPRLSHYACIVDLLGRAGHLNEAQVFIENMPLKPNASVWGALLAACRANHNIEVGETVAEYLFALEPQNTGNYASLSQIYAAAGRWDDVEKVRQMIKENGLKRRPGCSWIQVNNRVHVFLAGDKSHPQTEKIYATLQNLALRMREVGYLPDTKIIMHDLEEEKHNIVFNQSKKLEISLVE